MYDPTAVGRRSALRATVVQALVVGLVATVFSLSGGRQALAAALGGGALVVGSTLAAWVSLRGIVSARAALARVMVGTALKWAVVIGAFAVGLGVWRLPPLPMLAGLAAGTLAYLWALNLRLYPSTRTQL